MMECRRDTVRVELTIMIVTAVVVMLVTVFAAVLFVCCEKRSAENTCITTPCYTDADGIAQENERCYIDVSGDSQAIPADNQIPDSVVYVPQERTDVDVSKLYGAWYMVYGGGKNVSGFQFNEDGSFCRIEGYYGSEYDIAFSGHYSFIEGKLELHYEKLIEYWGYECISTSINEYGICSVITTDDRLRFTNIEGYPELMLESLPNEAIYLPNEFSWNV